MKREAVMNNTVYKRAMNNIKRSGWRAYAVVFMMTITYLILGLLLTIIFVSQSIASYFVQKPEVIGFFNDGVTEEQILEVKRQIEENPYAAEVRYVSKEEAMKSFLEENSDNKDVVEGVTVNVFPAHLNVRSTSLDKIPEIADFFRNNELISDVLASESFISTLRKVVIGIQVIAGSLLVVFTISTVFIIFLTIGMTIYTQKNELIVMKLVGATKGYIRAPYVIQSVIYSMLALLVSLLILLPVLLTQYDYVMDLLLGDLQSPALNVQIMVIGVAIELIFALFLAIFGSFLATRRYIDR
jgi:cell division transport system permease protein